MSLVVQDLSKKYGTRTVVDHLSFEMNRPGVYALLGTNGAGKTTSIRMMLGMLSRDSGTVTWNGKPLDINNCNVGYLAEERGLYPKYTIMDQLMYFAALRGVSASEAKKRIHYWAERFDIIEYLYPQEYADIQAKKARMHEEASPKKKGLFASCKSSESAYKKAYEKAKQQELAEPQVEAPVEVTPVVAAPVTTTKVADTSGVRQEKVTVVSGNEGLKDYSVVAGSFGVKANAEGLKDWLDGQGYHSTIAFNADKAMYRVIVNSFADKTAAAEARDAFKAKYPNRSDFQGAWLLYRVY